MAAISDREAFVSNWVSMMRITIKQMPNLGERVIASGDDVPKELLGFFWSCNLSFWAVDYARESNEGKLELRNLVVLKASDLLIHFDAQLARHQQLADKSK